MPEPSPEKKIRDFLAIAIPIFTVLWLTLYFYGSYMAPGQFRFLPRSIRELHILSLFFRNEAWSFPLSLVKTISPPAGYPLALSDSVPLMALLFKFLGFQTVQYFGAWFLASFLLSLFFAYRMSRRIFKNDPIKTGLGAAFFIFMPFAWYHPYWVPWAAGQWTTLWALSLFFQKRRHLSREWYGVLVFSALIHPFFVLSNVLLGTADIFRLYLYKHRISVVQAAGFFGNIFTVAVIAMAGTGTFFTQTFADPSVKPPPLVFSYLFFSLAPPSYTPSYLYPGLGILLGLVPTPFIAMFNPAVKYIRRYRPLIFCFIVFFIAALGGGFLWRGGVIKFPWGSWVDERVFSILSSGPRFLTPILWMLPVLVLQNFAWLEKAGHSRLCLGLLIFVLGVQIYQFRPILPESEPEYVDLGERYQNFIADRGEIIWIHGENDFGKVPYFEQLAYYAYREGKTISSAPSARIGSGYKIAARKNRADFIKKDFNPNCVYVLRPEDLTGDLYRRGRVLRMGDVFLFKAPQT